MADADDMTRGLTTAVAMASAAPPPWTSRPVQGGLFPAHGLDDLTVDPMERTSALRKRGRPAGAKNKSTNEWREFLEANYTHPLQFLAETISRSPHDLADELGCKPVDAFAVQVRAAMDLAPYVASKQPVAIQLDGKMQVVPILSAEAALAMWGQQDTGAMVLDMTQDEENAE